MNNFDFLKSITLGMIIGSATAIILTNKKQAMTAAKNIGNSVTDNVSSIFNNKNSLQ